jgi:hypothetical protein
MNPNENLLENYPYRKVDSFEFFNFAEKERMPLQMCVWRPKIGIYHFFIITELTKDDVHVMHKTAKDPAHLVAAFVFGINEFTKIQEEKIPIESIKLTNEKAKKNHLFDFNSGVYVLGSYSDEQKQNATERLQSMKGKKQIYSLKD